MQNNVQMNKEIWVTNSVKNDLITEESIYVFILCIILDFSFVTKNIQNLNNF